MAQWKKLFSSSERTFIPEVVVPLPRDPASVTLESNAEKNDSPSDQPPGYRSSSDQGSRQEKGSASVPATGQRTVESLRAEVEAGVVVSGHDSIYDRMFASRGDCPALSRSLV